MNVEFSSVKERRVDIVYKCIVDLQEVIAQIEIQLYYERYFPIRMLGYWTDLKQRFPEYPIIQIVLTCGRNIKNSFEEEVKIKKSTGKETKSSDQSETEKSAEEEIWSVYVKSKYIVIDLCEIPFERFLSFDNPNINAFGILSKDCDVGKLLQRIIDYKLAEEQTASLITKIYILSKLAKRDKEVEKFMQETQKINLMEYDLFREAIERGLKEGREKGLKEGREKGLKEGLIKGLEVAIRSRFGSRSQRLISKLRQVDDLKKLHQIAKKFSRVKSIKDIEKILLQNS
ncbi:MAG: hypothetical protein RMJ45_07670 [Candidatus Calescibacterium sp.]|nr:hypothetical protein [Candidatus Calescibacterium sp.]